MASSKPPSYQYGHIQPPPIHTNAPKNTVRAGLIALIGLAVFVAALAFLQHQDGNANDLMAKDISFLAHRHPLAPLHEHEHEHRPGYDYEYEYEEDPRDGDKEDKDPADRRGPDEDEGPHLKPHLKHFHHHKDKHDHGLEDDEDEDGPEDPKHKHDDMEEDTPPFWSDEEEDSEDDKSPDKEPRPKHRHHHKQKHDHGHDWEDDESDDPMHKHEDKEDSKWDWSEDEEDSEDRSPDEEPHPRHHDHKHKHDHDWEEEEEDESDDPMHKHDDKEDSKGDWSEDEEDSEDDKGPDEDEAPHLKHHLHHDHKHKHEHDLEDDEPDKHDDKWDKAWKEIPPLWSDDGSEEDSDDEDIHEDPPPPHKHEGPPSHKHHHKHHHPKHDKKDDIPVPYGVNFGSWLSLEDYFYVGPTGAVQVATPDGHKSAVCLPPLHTGQGPTWQSETDLLTSLMQSTGLAHALKIFHAHRTSYVTETDLEKLSQWGVKHVRIPLSWCFTDASFEAIDLDNTTQAYTDYLLKEYTCADPYYREEGVLWPALPRKLLVDFLRDCANHSITASLDLHTYPGATSPGTFSGLWPREPRFWYHDTPQDPEHDLGRFLYRGFIAWIEELAETDPKAFEGILGISPMNEPAHLAGVFRRTSRDYLPPLSPEDAQAYLARLGNNPDIPDGPHLRSFLWQQDALNVFNQSTLPGLGIQLHVNIHESVLSPELAPENATDEEAAYLAHTIVAAWWSEVTDAEERSSWAVLDMHHYHAWDSRCQGASDGPPSGNYTCTDAPARAATLKRCAAWAPDVFRALVNQHCEPTALLMSGEFSASTHHSVRHACSDLGTLKATYLAQMEAAHRGEVKSYFWSYKMPHGGASKNAWSFSHLMYLLGVNPHPDDDNYSCGGHIPHEDEVTDDWFTP